MATVLDENRWAKEMIESHSLGKKPSETLRRVARYYYDLGNTKSKTRKYLELFLRECNPSVSIPRWDGAIETALNLAKKYKAICVPSIPITQPEIDTIAGFKSVMVQRLAFTILCLAKYWDAVTGSSSHWLNNKDSEIMRMANINTSIRRQSALYYELMQAGLIQFSYKVDNTNIKVKYIQDGPVAMNVTDLRNLGFQYAMHRDASGYLKCENCGIVIKRKNVKSKKPQRYCDSCAAEIRLRQNVESVMRQRSSNRSSIEKVGI